jgi:protein PhnA
MSELPACPKCHSSLAYEDPSGLLMCPECGNEWSPAPAAAADTAEAEGSSGTDLVVRDAVGNILQDGDTVVLIKDLKVKGSPTGLKAGTKVKKIRLVEGDHNIDCRVDGIGQMGLKSEFVKKA